jgi:hypothetical protein
MAALLCQESYLAVPLNDHPAGCADMFASIDDPHTPLAQTRPQPLQLCGSLAGSTHVPLHTIWPLAQVGGGGDESTMEDESIAGDESTAYDESATPPASAPRLPPASVAGGGSGADDESFPESLPFAPPSSDDAAASNGPIAPVSPSRETSAHPMPVATAKSDAAPSNATRPARG